MSALVVWFGSRRFGVGIFFMNSSLVTLTTFSFRFEAERLQQVLQSEGIGSMIKGDDASGWNPVIGLATGGMTVLVNQADYESAKLLLDELKA